MNIQKQHKKLYYEYSEHLKEQKPQIAAQPVNHINHTTYNQL